MADVFLSYIREDKELIAPLIDALQREGFTVWWDYDLETGDDWLKRIVREIDVARCVVGVWTRQAVDSEGLFRSDYVTLEHRRARDQKKLAGVMMDSGSIAFEFSNLQASDLSGWNADLANTQWKKLTQRIEELATTGWMQRRLATIETDLTSERVRRERAEATESAYLAKLQEEAKARSEAETNAVAKYQVQLAQLEKESRESRLQVARTEELLRDRDAALLSLRQSVPAEAARLAGKIAWNKKTLWRTPVALSAIAIAVATACISAAGAVESNVFDVALIVSAVATFSLLAIFAARAGSASVPITYTLLAGFTGLIGGFSASTAFQLVVLPFPYGQVLTPVIGCLAAGTAGALAGLFLPNPLVRESIGEPLSASSSPAA